MRGRLLIALVCLASSAVATAPLAIRGLVFDGLPPERFQRDTTTMVAFVSDLSVYCGRLPAGKRWGGCRRGQVVYVENPCQRAGDYTRRLCHEMGHANGWSRYHEF